MKSQTCLQMQLRVPPQFHLLLNHFINSYAMTIAWASVTQMQLAGIFSASSGASFCASWYRSWSASSGAIPVALSDVP